MQRQSKIAVALGVGFVLTFGVGAGAGAIWVLKFGPQPQPKIQYVEVIKPQPPPEPKPIDQKLLEDYYTKSKQRTDKIFDQVQQLLDQKRINDADYVLVRDMPARPLVEVARWLDRRAEMLSYWKPNQGDLVLSLQEQADRARLQERQEQSVLGRDIARDQERQWSLIHSDGIHKP